MRRCALLLITAIAMSAATFVAAPSAVGTEGCVLVGPTGVPGGVPGYPTIGDSKCAFKAAEDGDSWGGIGLFTITVNKTKYDSSSDPTAMLGVGGKIPKGAKVTASVTAGFLAIGNPN